MTGEDSSAQPLGPSHLAPGDRIVFRCGGRDREMEFHGLDESLSVPHEPGWLWMRVTIGAIAFHNVRVTDEQTVYARHIDNGVYEIDCFPPMT